MQQPQNYCLFLKSSKYNRNLGCKYHDQAYGINGGGNGSDRKRADLALYAHMKLNEDYLAIPTFISVRVLGWLFFNYHGKPWRGQLIYKIVHKNKPVHKKKVPVCPKIHSRRPGRIKAFISLLRSPLNLIYQDCFSNDYINFKCFNKNGIIVNKIERINEILTEKNGKYCKSAFVNKALQPLLRTSIFNSNGEDWLKYRQILSHGLSQLKVARSFNTMISGIDVLLKRIETLPSNKSINVEYEMSYVTADIILRCIMSKSLDDKDAQEIFDAFISYQRYYSKVMLLSSFCFPYTTKKLWKYGNKIRRVLLNTIQPRYDAFHTNPEASPNHDDILATLISRVDVQSGDHLTLDEVVDQTSMLFLAGHETSASTLSWALYLLAISPTIQDEVVLEINQTVGDEDILIEHIPSLVKVKHVILEALRLYPPVYILPRQAITEVRFDNEMFTPGNHIIGVSPWLLHRNEKYWSTPHCFNPDQFSQIDAKEKHQLGHFIPFGKGKRGCIGEAFAMQESILVLASLVRKYKFSISSRSKPFPVARITIRAKNGIYLNIIERSSTETK